MINNKILNSHNKLSCVSFLCLVSLELPLKMQTLRSLMLWLSALKCNGRGRSFFNLIGRM